MLDLKQTHRLYKLGELPKVKDSENVTKYQKLKFKLITKKPRNNFQNNKAPAF